MPVKKVAISLSSEALALADRLAAQEGLSRSAWFERAVLRAKRRAGIASAVGMAQRSGIAAASDAELARLRQELAKSA
jgi:hypothetical protein